MDIFEHDDGVVDHDADREREREQASIEFSVMSIARITVNVVMIEVGMAMELISTVRRSRMNNHTMKDASRLPRIRCSSRALTELRM